MRILFISFFFPPYNEMSAVRTGKTAKYLLEFGHDVRVISARDQSLRSTSLPLEIPPERVIYTAWPNPRRLVERIYGRSSPPPWRGTQAPAFRASQRGRLVGALQQFVRSVLYFPDAQVGWYPFARRAAARVMADWKPDLIFASASPATCLLIAASLSARYRVPWVGELRDPWTDYYYVSYPQWRRQIESRLERRVLKSAAGLVTVSAPLARALESRHHRPTIVVMNGFDPNDYPQSVERAPDDGVLRLVYTGMIYSGRQLPDPLFQALGQLGAAAGRVRVSFYGSDPHLVGECARRYGVEELVQVHDAVPRAQAARAQKQADVLLHLLWNDPSQTGVYSGKLFEYIGARRPILAVGPTNNVAADLIRERGAGVALDDPDRIVAQLLQWIALKEHGSIPDVDPAASAGLQREEQTRRLEAFLCQCAS